MILDWLFSEGLDVQFEEMDKTNLAEILRRFYPSARQKSDDDNEGKSYAKQSFINIRSAINRHLQLPPHNKTWDLVEDSEFKAANRVFSGKLRNKNKIKTKEHKLKKTETKIKQT